MNYTFSTSIFHRFPMNLKNHILFLYNGGLNPLNSDPTELRRRRTFSLFILSLNPVACSLMLSNSYLDSASDNPYIAAGIFTINLSLYVQAFFNQRFWAANLSLFVYWIVVLVLFSKYGLIGTPIFWLFPLAPMAILLSGILAGWCWCFISISTLCAVWGLEASGILLVDNSLRILINTTLDSDSGLIFAGDGSIIILVLTSATAFFKRAQTTAELKLRETVSSLRKEVTTRRTAEKIAIDSEKAKTAFLAAMGHELRTPLNGIIGASRILNESEDQNERQEFNNIILQSGETLLELINNVMDISSLDSGKVVLESRPIHLTSFMEQTLSPFVFQSYSKNIEIRHEIAENLPETILGDPTRLRQIIINLAGNAIKFTHKGYVSVLLDQDKNELKDQNKLRIRVLDTGIGIPSALQAKLFEPYVQADVDTTRKYGGSGLGLAIVKRLSHAMEGKISFKSTPDQGTCFTLILPLVKAPETLDVDINSNANVHLALPKLDILVVDDNAVNRMVLAKILEKDNHNVVSVTNGLEAVEYANNHDLDLILMDIQMPEMDGLTATKTIRARDCKNCDIPIIAITANLAASDRTNALDAGMDGFISKPFRYEELVTVINNNLHDTRKNKKNSGSKAPT